MALKDDPKVQELIEKASTKAAKDALKEATAAVKTGFATAIGEADEDKAAVKVLKAAQKTVLAQLKEAA